jgi:two-component system chemotaxis response regulator CheB
MSSRRVKVLVVDDSALARKIITDSLTTDPEIDVIGGAIDPFIAREKILTLNPDVLTLDIEMPRMDGLTFLKLLMRHRPMPVIVMSSLTQEGSTTALEALQAGAVDVIGKPSGALSAYCDNLILAEKVKAAAQARLLRAPTVSARIAPTFAPGNPRDLIVLGASTGGTEALKTVLTAMPESAPPICVVQHIPAQFSGAFAARLDSLCAIEVREARSGDELAPGLALIAPGGKHLFVRWANGRYVACLSDAPPVHHQRPSVDVLFDSVVKAGGARNTVAALLTGMGRDGASGLYNLRQNGAFTIAQSEATCVVFGMPRQAIELGAAEEVVDLQNIAGALLRASTRRCEAFV